MRRTFALPGVDANGLDRIRLCYTFQHQLQLQERYKEYADRCRQAIQQMTDAELEDIALDFFPAITLNFPDNVLPFYQQLLTAFQERDYLLFKERVTHPKVARRYPYQVKYLDKHNKVLFTRNFATVDEVAANSSRCASSLYRKSTAPRAGEVRLASVIKM